MSGYVSKEDILSGVLITDIAEEFGITLEEISSGSFNYRCRCPSPNHKGGGERTGSLYINADKNDFYCFGCGASSNCIDFYMICADKSFSEATSELRTRVVPGSGSEGLSLPKEDVFYILLQTSTLFRKRMLEHKKDLPWINSLMKYTDGLISGLKRDDSDKAKKILNGVKKAFFERYGE